MNLRALKESDLEFIAEAKKDFHDGWNLSMLLSSFKTGRFFGIIAEDGGTPFGFITYSVIAPEADIESVYISSEKRRQGAGSALIFKAEENLKKMGVNKIFLEVREKNAPAISLYVKNGFVKISERKNYYGDENADVYVKEI